MSRRVEKVESLVQQTVAAALVEELAGDAAAITVTRVDVSPDFRQAIVWLGMLGPEADHARLLKAVERAGRSLQARVSDRMATRHAPHLLFRLDSGGAYAAEIEQLLKRLPE